MTLYVKDLWFHQCVDATFSYEDYNFSVSQYMSFEGFFDYLYLGKLSGCSSLCSLPGYEI